jgi:hypothetical protein
MLVGFGIRLWPVLTAASLRRELANVMPIVRTTNMGNPQHIHPAFATRCQAFGK